MPELMEDRNPESPRNTSYRGPKVPTEHIKLLSDLLNESINIGLGTTGADAEQDAIIAFADDWLMANAGMGYEPLTELLELADAGDAVDWAWSQSYYDMGLEEGTYQPDVKHGVSYLSPGGVLTDIAMAGWSIFGDPVKRAITGKPQLGLKHHLERGWDFLGSADERLKGHEPNPYGNQLANVTGVHNWGDAAWLALDVVDIISLKYGGAIIEPTKQYFRNAAARNRAARLAEQKIVQPQPVAPRDVAPEDLSEEYISQIVRNGGFTDGEMSASFEARNRAPYGPVSGGSDGPFVPITDPLEIWSYPLPVRRIISGGQTGGDQAGLYAGRDLGIETGGTAPAGYKVWDESKPGNRGSDPDLQTFGLTTHHEASYPPRTRQNVKDSTGTIYFDFHGESAGLAVTRKEAKRLGRPFKLITDMNELNTLEGITKIRAWLVNENIETLNVAGNRQSSPPHDFDMFTNVRNWLNDILGEPPEELGFTGARLNPYQTPQKLEVPEGVVTQQQHQRDLVSRIDEKRAARARENRIHDKPIQMNFVFGEGGTLPAAEHIKSSNTFDAIVAGERTATTRRGSQLNHVNVGDTVTFARGGDRITVRVTGKRTLENETPEDWARREGYDPQAAADNWTEGKKFSEQTQIKFEVLDDAVGKVEAPVNVAFLQHAKVEHRRGVVDEFDVHEIDADIRAQPPSGTDPEITPPLEPKPVDGWQDSHMKRGTRQHEGRLVKPQTRVMGVERGVRDDGTIDYGTYFYTDKMFQAEPLTPLIKEIKERVEEITGYDFDIVLAQRYQDGSTDLGWHSDLAQKWDAENNRAIRERGTEPESVVVSLNFGATRDFAFTNTKRGTPMPADQRVLRLGNGDVLIMMEGTNANYRHSILRADPNDVGLRINLTFRRLDPKLQAVPRRTAAGAIDESLQDPSEIAAKLGRLEREKAEIVRRGSNASPAERRRLREIQEEVRGLREAREGVAADAGPREGTSVNYVKGQNQILSNFAELPFRFRGQEFKTAEGAYQAYKSGGYRPGYENLTGLGAKNKGRGKHTKTVKVDGEYWNVDLMREILRQKYMQVPEFRDALNATTGSITHPVGDAFWKRQFPELLEELRGSEVGMGDAGRTIRSAADEPVEYTEEMAQQAAYEEEVLAKIPEEQIDEFGEEMDLMEKDALFRMEAEVPEIVGTGRPDAPSPVAGQTFKHFTTPESAAAIRAGSFDPSHPAVHKTGSKARLMPEEPGTPKNPPVFGDFLYLSVNDNRWSTVDVPTGTGRVIPSKEYPGLPHPDKDPPSVQEFYGADPSDRGHNDLVPGPKTWDYKKIEAEYARLEKEGAHISSFYDYDIQKWRTDIGGAVTTPLEALDYVVSRNARILTIDETTIKSLDDVIKDARSVGGQLTNSQGQKVHGLRRTPGNDSLMNYYADQGYDVVVIRIPEGDALRGEYSKFWSEVGDDQIIVLNPDAVTLTAPPAASVNRNPRTQKIQEFEQTGGGGGHEFLDDDEIKTVIEEYGDSWSPDVKAGWVDEIESEELALKTDRVEKVTRFSVESVRTEPDKVYVFGDNMKHQGKGGQAIIRDEDNAFGIPTKNAPHMREDAFWSDDLYDTYVEIIDAAFDDLAAFAGPKTVVFPKDGIGTGRAQLSQRAPRLLAYIDKKIEDFAKATEVADNFWTVGPSDPTDATAIARFDAAHKRNHRANTPPTAGEAGHPAIGSDWGKDLTGEAAATPKGRWTEKGWVQNPEYRRLQMELDTRRTMTWGDIAQERKPDGSPFYFADQIAKENPIEERYPNWMPDRLSRSGPRWPVTYQEALGMTELEQFKRTGWPTPEINLDPRILKEGTQYHRVPSSEGKFLRDPEKPGIDPDTGRQYQWDKIYEGAPLGSPGSVRTLSDKEILAIVDEHGWKWGDETVARVRNIIVKRAELRAQREGGQSVIQSSVSDRKEYKPLQATAAAAGSPRNWPTTIVGDQRFRINPETGELIPIKRRKK